MRVPDVIPIADIDSGSTNYLTYNASDHTSDMPRDGENDAYNSVASSEAIGSISGDACFGVLVIPTMITLNENQSNDITPLLMKPLGGLIKLSFQDSDEYAGILGLPALRKLLDEVTISLSTTLHRSSTGRNGTLRRKTNKPQLCDCVLRIIVRGSMDQRYSIGNLLSEAGLYLQHPSATEIESDAEYSNPHYLVRPGSQMPTLDRLSINEEENTASAPSSASERMNEMEKSRIMQIFDLASDNEIVHEVAQSNRLKSTLKSHQLTALAMMIEKEQGIVHKSIFPSLWEAADISGSRKRYRNKITGLRVNTLGPIKGGILADDMGLGKTLSILALVCWYLDAKSSRSGTGPTLVVTPKSILPAWQHQIQRHIHSQNIRVEVYYGPTRRQVATNFKDCDIVLTTYETLRNDWTANDTLYQERWHRVVLDEAHHIRNRSSQLFKAACAIPSHYRWCLTGTPVHNSLDDYGALLSFVRVPQLTEKAMFDFWITSPIKKTRTSCGFDRLQSLVKATCLRRTKTAIGYSLDLLPRIDEVEYVDLHPADQEVYEFFKTRTANIASGASSIDSQVMSSDQAKDTNILSLLNFLRLICNHGEQLLPESAVVAWNARDSSSVDWEMMDESRTKCTLCERDVEDIESACFGVSTFPCRHVICLTCAMQDECGTIDTELTCPKCRTYQVENKSNCVISSALPRLRPSAKIEALLKNLRIDRTPQGPRCVGTPNKSVVFSYWVKMLNLIQQALEAEDYQVCRIDGSSSLEQRRNAINQFNDDPDCTIMLASIGSAGEGWVDYAFTTLRSSTLTDILRSRIDLTVANRVHLIEPHWNPMAESQAVDRVHRIGQVREVVIRRYVTRNTIETYIQWVQQQKLKLISRMVDSDEATQADIDMERWQMLQQNLGC
ncbi:SNF2 family N-terminal domain-containing protein [Pyrenochaeta sp. MPI-SDFR-AT-0127]|nr:SNF2 family N-terminal domain-containing protein [Pyrenochaeta sp. MPI-SDFR-AT-0127]